MTNMSSPRRPASFARQLALAVALATGTAVLAVPGFTFETADSDEINVHAATREVLLRSAP